MKIECEGMETESESEIITNALDMCKKCILAEEHTEEEMTLP